MIPDWFWQVQWSVVREQASSFNLDPFIVGAIVMVESYGNPCAVRYEPGFFDRYLGAKTIRHSVRESVEWFAEDLQITEMTERKMRATSWGPMQVMGQVAREHGFKGHFPKLCDADVGIHYGSKHLRAKMDVYGSTNDAIAAYNAGSVRKTSGGMYVNEQYVDKVMKYYRVLRDL